MSKLRRKLLAVTKKNPISGHNLIFITAIQMQIFLKEFDHATTLKRLILNQNKIHKNGKGWFGVTNDGAI